MLSTSATLLPFWPLPKLAHAQATWSSILPLPFLKNVNFVTIFHFELVQVNLNSENVIILNKFLFISKIIIIIIIINWVDKRGKKLND